MDVQLTSPQNIFSFGKQKINRVIFLHGSPQTSWLGYFFQIDPISMQELV